MPDRLDHSALFRRYLETSDLAGIRKLWKHINPHLPQPVDDYQTQVMLHSARVQSQAMPLKLRLYSHDWLLANDLPSHLPEALLAFAARNTFTKGVGIVVMAAQSVSGNPDEQKQNDANAEFVRKAMSDAVEQAFADGKTSYDYLRQRMDEARDRAVGVLRRFGGAKINVSVSHDLSGMNVR